MHEGNFNIHVRFPQGVNLLGWSHPEGVTLQAYRETGTNGPDDRGEIFSTLELGLDCSTAQTWAEANSLIMPYLTNLP